MQGGSIDMSRAEFSFPNKAEWRWQEQKQAEKRFRLKPNFLVQCSCNLSSPFMPSLALGYFSLPEKEEKLHTQRSVCSHGEVTTEYRLPQSYYVYMSMPPSHPRL